jgi:hypothetical protein
MRKLAVFLASAATLSMPADTAAETVGVKAGLTAATLSSYETGDANESFGTSSRAGATAGVFVDIPVIRHLVLEAGVDFVQKGARLTEAGAARAHIAVATLSYLEFPVVLRCEAGQGRVRPFGIAGPSFGINVSAHVDASASGGPASIDVRNQVRTADMGIAAGGGVTVDSWFVEGRVTQGIIDVGETPSVDRVIRTRTVSLIAGFRF